MIIVFLLAFIPVAQAAAKQPPLPDINTVESYLNSLVTLQSHFIQTANDGRQATGTFMLKRPGRLRFEYDPPVKDFIVADGGFIYYYDGQMKQQSSTPISKSLADFFLRDELRLSGDISISDIKRMEDHLLYLTLVQSKDPLAGSLTLMFGENPLELKKWRIVDAQGLTTEVALSDTRTGVSFDNNIFHYYNPEKKESLINK